MGISAEFQLRALTYCVSSWELICNLVRNPLAKVFPPPDQFLEDLSGQNCIITGANAGIGLATATEFCRRGCNVTLACRSKQKAQKAVQEINEALAIRGKRAPSIRVAELNLSSMRDVRRFCTDIKHSGVAVNYLVLNAGIMGTDNSRRETEDKVEEHFQVNHLSQWLLTHQLVGDSIRRQKADHLQRNSHLRVVILSSCTHTAGKIELDDLQITRDYSGFRAYTASKLANILTVRQLQSFIDRQEGGNVTAVAVHPGMVKTDLALGWMTGSDAFSSFLRPLTRPLFSALKTAILEPPEQAVRTILYAARAPSSEVKGRYVAYSKTKRGSRRSNDLVMAQRLWQESLHLANEVENDIEQP